MPANGADWYIHARERCRVLAHQLVRMDDLADGYDAQGEYVKADAVRWDRDAIRHERSRLMREIWQRRRVQVPR